MSQSLLLKRVDGVGVMSINRPHARNAINSEAAADIAAALDAFDQDTGVRVIVLEGAGGSFCAGMDLKAFLAGDRGRVPGRGFAGLVEAPPCKPIIAAVEGYALGGGLELALACDLIVAAEDARLGLPEVKRGLVANAGGLLRLPRQLPFRLAMEMVLTGELVSPSRLYAHGLINEVAASGGALEAAMRIARTIAANAPKALRVSKRILIESGDWPLQHAFAIQNAITAPVFASEDAKEGAQAFAQKRKPVWMDA